MELGVFSAVLQFNDGACGISKVFSLLGIKQESCNSVEQLIMKRCLRQRDLRKSDRCKMQRKRIRARREGFSYKEKEAEGSASYASGAF